MGRVREHAKNNVISLRVSDAELDTLEEIMSVTNKRVSDIMRDAMELLKTVPFESLVMAGRQTKLRQHRGNAHGCRR